MSAYQHLTCQIKDLDVGDGFLYHGKLSMIENIQPVNLMTRWVAVQHTYGTTIYLNTTRLIVVKRYGYTVLSNLCRAFYEE